MCKGTQYYVHLKHVILGVVKVTIVEYCSVLYTVF